MYSQQPGTKTLIRSVHLVSISIDIRSMLQPDLAGAVTSVEAAAG